MEQIIEQVVVFATANGWQIGLIALLGIVLLGVLKYCDVFKKIDKEKRKPIYFAISVGASLVGTIVYLLIIKQFNWEYIIGLTGVIYGLNQTAYTFFENTKLRDLAVKLLDWIVSLFKKKVVEKK